MQCFLCKLRTHQWCFLFFNVLLFHALLFGADFVEDYLLQPTPSVYTDASVVVVREKARKLDLSNARKNISHIYPFSNSDACRTSDIFLLTVVFSFPENVTQRQTVRKTWGNQTFIHGFPVKALFFVGSVQSSAVQETLKSESEYNGDLVQVHSGSDSSLHSFKNRMLLALQWVITFCPLARFILLTEDTVFVNLPAIGGYLLGLHRNPEDLYLGRVIQKDSPKRIPNTPGYLSPTIYPEKFLPDYCDGTTYILSQDVVRKVFVASEAVDAPVPADVFVGLCAQKAGVTPTHSARFSGKKHIRYNACCYRYIFSSAGMGSHELERVWVDLGQKGERCSVFQTYYGLVTCKAMTYLDNLSFPNLKGKIKPNG